VVKNMNSLSRAVSQLLRHEPWLYELELDEDGWGDVNVVLAVLRQESPEWLNLTETDVAEMIRLSYKQRHELVNGRIRALYGHSLPSRINRTPTAPPSDLFHGTAPASKLGIRQEGLLPKGRQYVHLSTDRDTAVAVGRRKSSDPIILLVKAQEAWKAGVAFYECTEKVWLADHVPSAFIDFGDVT